MSDELDLSAYGNEHNEARIDEFWAQWRAVLAQPFDAGPAAPGKELVPIETQTVVVRQIPTEPETAAEAHALANLHQRIDAMFHKRRLDPDGFHSARYLFKAEAALELAVDEYEESLP